MSELEYGETKRGQPLLLYEGRSYTQKRICKNGYQKWTCRDRRCEGTLFTHMNEVVEKKIHTRCIPDVAKMEVEKCLVKCKKRAREELTPMNEIYKNEFSPVMNKGLDLVTQVPKFESIKSKLYRNRHAELGSSSLPANREDISLPEKYKENFLIIDDGNMDKILIFCTKEGGKSLLEGRTFFGDGTFKSCCPQFQQLYTIHVDLAVSNDEVAVFPVIYALLPDKTEETYTRLLQLVKNYFPSWSPQYWKIDFEVAMLQAIKTIFPSSVIKGCNFHYNQCLWRKVQELGLVKGYTENEAIRTHIRMLAALAHLPPEAMDDGFMNIMENSPTTEGVTKFNDYMVEQWLDNPTIGYMWNCYRERHRTTNALESWHSALNRSLRKSHPNIMELIIKLKEDAQYYDLQRLQFQMNMPARKRQLKYINLDKRIQKIVSDFEENRKTLKDCLLALTYTIKLD